MPNTQEPLVGQLIRFVVPFGAGTARVTGLNQTLIDSGERHPAVDTILITLDHMNAYFKVGEAMLVKLDEIVHPNLGEALREPNWFVPTSSTQDE